MGIRDSEDPVTCIISLTIGRTSSATGRFISVLMYRLDRENNKEFLQIKFSYCKFFICTGRQYMMYVTPGVCYATMYVCEYLTPCRCNATYSLITPKQVNAGRTLKSLLSVFYGSPADVQVDVSKEDDKTILLTETSSINGDGKVLDYVKIVTHHQ